MENIPPQSVLAGEVQRMVSAPLLHSLSSQKEEHREKRRLGLGSPWPSFTLKEGSLDTFHEGYLSQLTRASMFRESIPPTVPTASCQGPSKVNTKVLEVLPFVLEEPQTHPKVLGYSQLVKHPLHFIRDVQRATDFVV